MLLDIVFKLNDLSYGKVGEKLEKATAKDYIVDPNTILGITSVGRSDTMPGHKYGPAVRPYYLIHYILSGSGEFKVNNVSYHLHAGQGFLIEPNYRTTYIADEQTPWSYVWLGFTGSFAEKIIKELTISEREPVFNSNQSYEIVTCVNEILAQKRDSPSDNFYMLSYLMRFLSFIAKGTVSNINLTKPSQNQYVAKAIEYISQNLTIVSVDCLAQAININRSYLSNLFKHELDLTPSEYIRNFRITKARHLLESSRINIDEVAERCGYEKTNTFTRTFHRIYGISPRQYRQQSQYQKIGDKDH